MTRLAAGLRRDLARVDAEIRAADHAGRYLLALALTDEAAAIRAEIIEAEGLAPAWIISTRASSEVWV